MKKALIVRYGAYGDAVIITPVIRELKKLGYYIIANVGDRTALVLKDNPYIDEFIFHEKDSVKPEDLEAHWAKLKQEHEPDKFINFCESIECNISLSPRDPQYTYTKPERYELCNRNFYEESFKWAGLDVPETSEKLRPEIFFTAPEIKQSMTYLKKDKFNILWCLSGSNKHKAYPWTEYVMDTILKQTSSVHFITVGDDSCKKIEPENTSTTKLCGKINMRESMCISGLVDLVISPDTGVLHASGAFDTPKIGLLGHTNIENITKHFSNDYSLESTATCAPCFRLIYDIGEQCPIDAESGGTWCQTAITEQILVNRINEIICQTKKKP